MSAWLCIVWGGGVILKRWLRKPHWEDDSKERREGGENWSQAQELSQQKEQKTQARLAWGFHVRKGGEAGRGTVEREGNEEGAGCGGQPTQWLWLLPWVRREALTAILLTPNYVFSGQGPVVLLKRKSGHVTPLSKPYSDGDCVVTTDLLSVALRFESLQVCPKF